MAKKTVATLQKKGAKDYTKAVKMVKSEKTGAYVFVEEMLIKSEVSNFMKK